MINKINGKMIGIFVNRALFRALLIIMLCSLAGCGKKSIFKETVDPSESAAVEVGDMENDTFYIKNGTKFYRVYEPNGNRESEYSTNRLYWVDEDITNIPEYYRNEIITYASENPYIEDVQIQRFRDNGYSLGLYGAKVDDDGYIAFSVKQNTIEDTEMNELFQTAKSDNIRIVTINNEAVAPDMLDTAGCITGLKEGERYQLTFYAGTYYQSATVTADTHFLQYYEAYSITEYENTKNGYLKLSIQDDAKSGYYYIGGQGLFKYYDFKKGERDTASVDLNEVYYTSENAKYSQFSQQFFALIDMDTRNAVFEITYETGVYYDEDILCTLIAPDDKTTYRFDVSNGTATVSLNLAVAGRYTMSVYPKDLTVISANVVGGYTKQDAMNISDSIHFDKDTTNMLFMADVIGSDNVWGTVTYEDGTAYEMSYDRGIGGLMYAMPYVKSGDYVVTIYYYEDSAIQNIRAIKDDSSMTQEIITVEE